MLLIIVVSFLFVMLFMLFCDLCHFSDDPYNFVFFIF